MANITRIWDHKIHHQSRESIGRRILFLVDWTSPQLLSVSLPYEGYNKPLHLHLRVHESVNRRLTLFKNFGANICSIKKDTKRSSNTLLCFVSLFTERTLNKVWGSSLFIMSWKCIKESQSVCISWSWYQLL